MTLDRIHKLNLENDIVRQMKPIGLSFPENVIEGDPQEKALNFIELEPEKVNVGVWQSDKGEVAFDAYPMSEICWIVEGQLTLISNSVVYSFLPGDAFYIPKGVQVTWVMPDTVTKYFIELL